MADLIQLLTTAGTSATVPTTTGSDFDPGVRNNAAPTSYTGTITIPACAAALFVTHAARATGVYAAPSLTVDGDGCTEIHSNSFNSNITRVYYLAAPSTGSVSYTVVDTGSYSIATAVIGLNANVSPSVSSTIFTPTNTASPATGLQTILSLSASPNTLIYSASPASNYVDESLSTNTPNSLFSPVAQALSGNINKNMIHCSSGVFTSSATYTVNYYLTNNYLYANSGIYLIMSW